MSSGPDRRLWSVVMERAGGGAVTVGHVCAAITAVTRVDGTAAVLATSATLRETVYADDETAARVEELTLTLGEGPDVDAVRHGGPILSANMSGPDALARWPVFAPTAVALGARAVFALPLRIGAIRRGVLTMYRRRAGDLTRVQIADGLALADVVCLLLLDQAGPGRQRGTARGRRDTVSRGASGHRNDHRATGGQRRDRVRAATRPRVRARPAVA
jgi:hypothetical protein